MESNRGKKKPGRGARPKKPPGRAAKAKAKVAVVGQDEEPAAAVVITDPWLGLRSPLGGKLSPAEEWKRLQDQASYGRQLTLAVLVMAKAVIQASTVEEFRLAAATDTLTGKLNHEEGDQEGHTDTSVTVASPAPAPDGDDRPVDDRPIERLVFCKEDSVLAFVNNTVSGCAMRLLTTALVKLDVGGTGLDDAGLETVIAGLTPWLRELSGAGNNLTRIPVLQGLGKLQMLDLSENKIGSVGPESFPPELGPNLRRLNLKGNRLDSLLVTAAISEGVTDKHNQGHKSEGASSKHQGQGHDNTTTSTHVCALSVLTSLAELNLSANSFESCAHSLAAVTRANFPRLISLDFRENHLPLDQETNELQRISKYLPMLKTLNGEAVTRQAMTLPSSKEPMFELLSTGDQCVKEGRREESCSCVEGNACAVAYHCRDWANRFEVAAAAAAAAANPPKDQGC